MESALVEGSNGVFERESVGPGQAVRDVRRVAVAAGRVAVATAGGVHLRDGLGILIFVHVRRTANPGVAPSALAFGHNGAGSPTRLRG